MNNVIVKEVMKVAKWISERAISLASINDAPNIRGIAKRNENFIASSFLNPRIKPEPIAIPLLETPGNNENT